MSNAPDENLLARLAGVGGPGESSDLWKTVAASEPDHNAQEDKADEKLDAMLDNIRKLSGDETPGETPAGEPATNEQDGCIENTFVPIEPESFRQAQLTESEVEALILKFLLARGDATGRDIADQISLPFVLVDESLRRMKNEQLVVHKGSAPMNDYQYQPTDLGGERGRRYAQHCTYFGSAPVALSEYIASVEQQSLNNQQPSVEHLRRAFDDLLLNRRILDRLGPAINSGRGMFLYGAPGNGKTSIAERVTKTFGQHIWIPRTVGVDGEVIRLFDPSNHEELPLEATTGLIDQRKVDKRWVRIRRPTIIAGGELTMSALEVTINTSTGVSEAPLQMKSNCGTLVIDDFGRQRMSIDELLNRWILP
ncbi:MAG: AAA family ATPase, partial [Candidatus Nealsonbacteria bacterium]|nr:AAA family ATPase [Candidatus Nealsonbacteria bacterium]